MSATIWMVLNPGQDRILLKTPSRLEAFRTACRRAGGSARLGRGNGFGVEVHGARCTVTVVPVPSTGQRPVVTAPPERPHPAMPNAEVVALPGGRSFIWVPAG